MVSLQEIGAIEENTFLGQKDRVFQIEAELKQVEEELIQRESRIQRDLSELKSRLKRNEIQKQ